MMFAGFYHANVNVLFAFCLMEKILLYFTIIPGKIPLLPGYEGIILLKKPGGTAGKTVPPGQYSSENGDMTLFLCDSVAEGDDSLGVLLPPAAQNGLVYGIVDDGHEHTGDSDGQTGKHGTFQTDDGADVGHNQAHACAHDQSGHRAEGVGKGIGRGLHLPVQRLQLVQRGVLLFGVLGADLLHQIFLIVLTVVHNWVPLSELL